MNETSSQPPEQKQMDNDKKITITLVLSWIFGVLFLIGGLGGVLSGDILPGTIVLILATIFLPPVIGPIEKKTKLKLSRGVKAIILIVGLVALGATINEKKGVEKGNQEKQAQPAKEMVDQQVATQQKTQETTNGGNVVVRLNKETGKSEIIAEAPAAEKESNNLGFSRSQIINKMRELEGEFKAPSLPKGKERLLQNGTKAFNIEYPDGVTILEILGNPDNAESVSFTAGIPTDKPAIVVRQLGRIYILLQLFTPSVDADWLNGKLDELNSGKKEIKEIHDNVRISIFDGRAIMGFISFSFEPE